MKLHEVAGKDSFSFLEVEAWDFNLFSLKEIVELPAEEFQIHRSESLEVVFSFFVARSQCPVYKIIVQLYHLRIHSEYAALQCKPF